MSDLTLDGAWYFDFRDTAGVVKPNQEMVDIAISSSGEMYGVSWDPAMTGSGTNFLYHVQIPQVVGTGVARADEVGQLSFYYNGLTFAPAGMVGPSEVLLAVDNDPGLSTTFMDQVDITNAHSTIGNGLGGGLKSSGDIVAIQGHGIFVAVHTDTGPDVLATVNPSTGVATVVGSGINTGASVWGLAWWNGDLLGFTQDKVTLRINPSTGVGTGVWTNTNTEALYGAAVKPTLP